MPLDDTPAPLSPRLGRAKIRHVPVVRACRVGDVAALTPTIVRLTLVGEELEGFTSLGPTDHVKLRIPVRASREAEPAGDPGATVAAQVDSAVRDYTPRACRARGRSGLPELDIDIALHGTDGPISAWAGRARAGDPVTVAGPRSSKLVPSDASSFLLGCDESGLPAVARWLELVHPDLPVTVLADVADPSAQGYPLAQRASVSVRWLVRGATTHESSPGLEQAVRDHGPLPDGCFAWFGGEAGALVGVRRYLRRELGLGADRVEVSGYWRLGSAGYDHHAPLDASDPE
ncbi:NADPH-dependent ferric-chelate reductase [mine drainage metagenome]|uniref:NADPH-dependent ferric-chelate reductase n=1 Tax=mine drainage metagenome TaxID=410659 RepID=A0A1J5RIS2_9ZZZZ